jgi:tetratricopeptide (TPR) repeat protein
MTDAEKVSKKEMVQAVADAIALTRAENYEEAVVAFEAFLPKLSSGTDDDKRLAASAFSFYGLCFAEVRKQYLDAKKYCELSLKVHPKDPDHYENLGKVHLLAQSRKGAVDALFDGLQYDPKHKGINELLNVIGRRRDPVISFLPRDNVLNVYLGKRRHEKMEERRLEAIARRKKHIAERRRKSNEDTHVSARRKKSG